VCNNALKTTIHLALAIGAMSLLASCAQESIISREYDPDQIAYKAFANNATKSGAVDNDHLGNIGDLYVSAIKLNDAGYYFSNNVISSSDVSSSTANSGNTPYYWPAYKLGFYAANRPLTVTESSAAKLTPSIDNFTVSRSALNAPDELMVALEAQQRDGNGTPVQLGLHHALSRLTIQVQKTIPGYDISVAGVQIGGFKSVGTFTFPQYNTTNATSDADWEGLVSANYGNSNNLHSCWGSLSTPLQYGYLDISSESLSGTAMTSTAQNVMDGNYFYVIPQSVTLTTAASGSSPDITDHWVDLLVNVKASANDVQIYPASADAGKYAVTRIYIPASQTFEAGKSYTVTLNFSNGIGVSESIQSNGKLEDVYTGTLAKSTVLASRHLKKVVSPEFPDDTFILGSAIDYTASVANWEAGTPVSANGGPVIPEPEPEPGSDPVSSLSPAALRGLFTINEDGDQVRFSKGNLRCYIDASGNPHADPDNSANTTGWAFADHQYDFVGDVAPNNDPLCGTAGWIDLFSWPNDSGNFIDWGTNQIYNGTSMDPANTWRTLSGTESTGEFTYLFNTRNSVTVNGITDARYAKCKVNDVFGILLFPDDWVAGYELSEEMQNKVVTGNINQPSPYSGYGNFYNVIITADEWLDFEAAGCVFLPCARCRYSSGYDTQISDSGRYSSSTRYNDVCINILSFASTGIKPADHIYTYFSNGYSVRLVQNAE